MPPPGGADGELGGAGVTPPDGLDVGAPPAGAVPVGTGAACPVGGFAGFLSFLPYPLGVQARASVARSDATRSQESIFRIVRSPRLRMINLNSIRVDTSEITSNAKKSRVYRPLFQADFHLPPFQEVPRFFPLLQVLLLLPRALLLPHPLQRPPWERREEV